MTTEMESEAAAAAAASGDDGGGDDHRKVARRMGRERLLNYAKDIIRIQNTPLRDVVRDHALHYLPAQSLLRFRAVAASWNRHISSPFFAHTQSHSARSLSGLFFHAADAVPGGGVSYLPFDPKADSVPDPALGFLPDTFHVAASSNGLVACRASSSHRGRPCYYYVCNPATAEWAALPPPRHRPHGAVALVFKPSALNFAADYHLVCTVSRRRRFEIFSSRTGTWRTSGMVIPEEAGDAEGGGGGGLWSWSSVAVGGAAYWRTDRGAVVSYHPDADEFHVIMPPPVAAGRWLRWQIGEMDGRLCCVGAEEGRVEVYVLEEGRSSWWKMGSLALDVAAGCPWPLLREGREEMAVVWIQGKVVGIEVRSQWARVLGEDVPESCFTNGVPYISSLVSVRQFRLERGERSCGGVFRLIDGLKTA